MKLQYFKVITLVLIVLLQPITTPVFADSKDDFQLLRQLESNFDKAPPSLSPSFKYTDNVHTQNIHTVSASTNQGSQETEKNSEDKPQPPTLRSNLFAWVTRILIERYEYEKECSKKNLFIRSGGNKLIAVPLLEGPRKLVSATRHFFLNWQGGKPPYRIRLSQKYERHPFIDRDLIQENFLQLESLTLSPGNYTLKIDDTEGRKIWTEFTVVPHNEVPPMPDEIKESDLSDLAKVTVYATWLASQQQRLWIFESYQRVAGMAGNYQPARLLRNALADGQPPGPVHEVVPSPTDSIEW